MGKLRAFRDCLESKQSALARIAAHQEWCHQSGGAHTRPCSVICLLGKFAEQDFDPGVRTFSYAEKVHGIPESVAKLHELIEGGLQSKEAASWTQRFYEAIPEGGDLSGVMFCFFHWAVTPPVGIIQQGRKEILDGIKGVARLYDRKLDGETISASLPVTGLEQVVESKLIKTQKNSL